VASIAHRWGFTHLSRFAAAYKKRYGESPYLTLRG
jgi:AraC-like DNA-binding protein